MTACRRTIDVVGSAGFMSYVARLQTVIPPNSHVSEVNERVFYGSMSSMQQRYTVLIVIEIEGDPR